MGLSGCHDDSGNGLTKTSMIIHLRDRHCKGDEQDITKQSLTNNIAVFDEAEVTFKRMGLWLCGVCFKTHTVRSKCRHGSSDFVPPPDCGDGIVRFVLYGLTKPSVAASSDANHVDALGQDVYDGFTLTLLDRLLSKREDLETSGRNIKQCKRKICDGHYTAAVRVLSSPGVALYTDVTLDDLKAKHPFKAAASLPNIPIDHHQLVAPIGLVLDMIKSFPRGTSCGRDGLRAQHLMDCFSGADVAILDELIVSITHVVNLFLDGKFPKTLGEYIASAPLTALVKPGGGICPIVVGTVWRRLVSKVSATMIGHSLDTYLNDLQFGVGVSGEGEAILHAVNRLVEDRSDDIGLSTLLVDSKSAFNLVDREVMEHTLWSNQGVQQDDPLGPLLFALVLHPLIWKVLELIVKDGPRRDLHLNVDKTEKRVAKSIELMDDVARHNDPKCELLLLRACAGISKLYFSMHTCSPHVFKQGQHSFDAALRSFLEHIVTAYGAGFGDWQWRLATLPFSYRGLGVYSAGDVLGYAFLASRLQSASLQTKVVLISGLGQNMNGKTYWCVLCYRLGVPLFSILKSCSACSRVFMGDIYGDHAVSCAGIGIKHRHNVVRDTLVDICHRSRISSGKEVDIGLKGGRDKSLHLVDVLLYSWDCRHDVCVDLTGSSPLTQTRMVDFMPGRAVVDATQRKRGKYMAKCAAIGYGFLSFSFSSFRELEADAVSLLKRIQKFSMTQYIGASAAVYIFNRISFSIAKEVGAQIVFRLPSNLL
nr:hypothetical protein [Tanacetum cinerariifolium]